MKRIKKISIILFVLFLFIAHNIFSQVSNVSYYKHELTLGVGFVNGFEKHVYNVPNDVGINSAPGVNVNYCYFLNKKIGVGIRAFGYLKTLPEYNVIYSNGTAEKISYEISTYNIDGEFRYIFNRGNIEPYGFLLVGAALGEVTGNNTKLAINGFNIGAGTGIKVNIGERWRLSTELIGAFGNAVWEKKPFVNSTSDEYIPSMIGVLINVSYLFGPEK